MNSTQKQFSLEPGIAKSNVLSIILSVCLLGSQAEAQDASAAKPVAQLSTEDRFEIRNLEGWTVYINRDVPRQYAEDTAKTLEHLRWELYQTKLAAPALAVRNLQEKNAIWIEYNEKVSLSYHPERSWLIEHGYTIPRDTQSFMSLSVKTHLGDSYRHPFVVFHELAHGYDFHFNGKGRGYGNQETQANRSARIALSLTTLALAAQLHAKPLKVFVLAGHP